MNTPTFFVISEEYVGPDQSRRYNAERYFIQSFPGRTNSSREVKITGWLGTTNDYSRHAHGQHNSLDEARAVIAVRVGGLRELENDDPEVLELYAGSLLDEWDAESSQNWCEEARSRLTASTTDDEISAIVAEHQEAAEKEGFYLDGDAVEKMLVERRDELEDELEAKRQHSLFDILDGYVSNVGDLIRERVEIEERLSDLDEIEAYAEGCGRLITTAEAARIRDVGLVWVSAVNDGNGEWSRFRHEAEEALS